jgi:hypothetical protein
MAKQYEKIDEAAGVGYTWSQSESLAELEDPERIAEIKQKHERALKAHGAFKAGPRLYQIFEAVLADEDDSEPCLICHL